MTDKAVYYANKGAICDVTHCIVSDFARPDIYVENRNVLVFNI